MGRHRKKNKHLPTRVEIHGRRFRYKARSGKNIDLGPKTDYAGMLRRLADLVSVELDLGTMKAVIALYRLQEMPKKAESTHKDIKRHLDMLDERIGHFKPRQVRAVHAAAIRDEIGAWSPATANHVLQRLSHVMTKAGEWGAIDHHPIKGLVQKLPIAKRERYASDEEFNAFRAMALPMIGFAMQISYLTGLRRGDVLGLTRDNLVDGYLQITPSKTTTTSGKTLRFVLTPELAGVIEAALKHPPQIRRCRNIIVTSEGKPYGPSAFNSAWRRTRIKFVKAGYKSFQFKDIRKKSATDEPDAKTASKRLGHSSQEFTDRVYRLNPETVRPLK